MSDALTTFWPGDRLITLTSSGASIEWVVEPDGWLHQVQTGDRADD